jgi:RNA polymerase sigma-70 factor (ECF subfamily)
MERERLEALYRQHGKAVFRRARALLADTQAAHDAVQDVFLRALGSHAEFEQSESRVAWLCKITTNHCLNRIRDAARRRELLEERAPRPVEGVSSGVESMLVVRAVLAQLPEELGEIAVYYYIDQMNQDEIAELLGVSRRTVGNRLEEFHAAASAIVCLSAEVSA